jgi:hypothetical protein
MSENMSITALEAEARTPEIAAGIKQIYAVQALVRLKAPVPLELAHAVKVLTEKGHVRYSARARRLMFTPEGAKFAKQAKKYAPRLGI